MKTLAALIALTVAVHGQQPAWTPSEEPLLNRIRTLRGLPDDQRAEATRHLALDIRNLTTPGQLRLATSLAGLATEGDFGKTTLQEVASTLAAAIERKPPSPDKPGQPAMPYMYLAQLIRYEHMQIKMDDPQLKVVRRHPGNRSSSAECRWYYHSSDRSARGGFDGP